MANPIRIKNIAIGTLVAITILNVTWVIVDKRKHSVIMTEKIEEMQLDSGVRIERKVEKSGLKFPPKKILMYADKTKRLLTVYGFGDNTGPVEITSYKFTGFSGRLGPKQREGDGQIPEGIYDLTALNPQSSFHLSIRIEYPNAFDKSMAAKENRTNLGGDIYIHGGRSTIGCIPIGNDNIEELFYLVKQTGLKNTDIVITPGNLNGIDIDSQTYPTAWQKELYKNIQTYIKQNLPNLAE